MSTGSERATIRDPRLDFFRGLGMFIILIAHIHDNTWTNWIPARFGFSDAAEIFVFCSGLAAAKAFGETFERSGLWLGTLRTAHRIWQIYWAHIATFVVTITVCIVADRFVSDRSYVQTLSLGPFLADPAGALAGLMTLTWVPNYFDILPMYLGLLAMMPAFVALQRQGTRIALGALVALWAVSLTGATDLPAEPWSDRVWFFNPFSWSIVFFTAFAFGRGWLTPPSVTRNRLLVAALYVVASVPLAWWPLIEPWPTLVAVNEVLMPFDHKTHLYPWRLAHFAALAYLVYAAAGPMGCNLRGTLVVVAKRVGQQTLPVFLFSMPLAWALTVLLDAGGRTGLATVMVNVLGLLALVAAAEIAAFFKSIPWKSPRRPSAPAPSRTDEPYRRAPPVAAE